MVWLGGEDGELLFSGYKVSVWDDEKVLGPQWRPYNSVKASQCPGTTHLKIVKTVNYIYIYIFYNEKITFN